MTRANYHYQYTHSRLTRNDRVVHLAYRYSEHVNFTHVMCESSPHPRLVMRLCNEVPTCIVCVYNMYCLERAGHHGKRVLCP